MGTRPAEISLVGIQPETMEIGLELSKTVMDRFEKLLQVIVEKLQEWGLEIKERTIREPVYVPGHSI
jgi:hydrogenase maturation protease